MFLKGLLYLTLCVVSSYAVIPDYIHVCARNHPDFNGCVIKSIDAMKDKLKEGIPDLDIPPIDPFTINRLDLADMPNFKAYATNVSVAGFSDYDIEYFVYNLDTLRSEVVVKFKELRMNSSYTVDARILVPIQGKGNVYLTTQNLLAKVKVVFKSAMRRGVKYVYPESMTTKLNLNDYNVVFDLDGGNKALYEGLRTVLQENHKELLDATTPNLERAVSEQCLQLGNKICQHFSYDELFPIAKD